MILTAKEVAQGIVGAPDKCFLVDIEDYDKFTEVENEVSKTLFILLQNVTNWWTSIITFFIFLKRILKVRI